MSWISWLFPPLCVSCGASVAEHPSMCAACWQKLTFIAPPHCTACGLPFAIPVDDGILCGTCLATPPPFQTLRAALVYDAACSSLIVRFKHSDHMHLAPLFTTWMHHAGQELWESHDRTRLVLVPVPLHPWRLLRRRYNQAAILARALGRRLGCTVAVDGLHRVRATPSQGHRTRKARERNVTGAFRITPRWRAQLRDARVVVIDDVVTTGATLNACVRALRTGGVHDIAALALARVVLTGG